MKKLLFVLVMASLVLAACGGGAEATATQAHGAHTFGGGATSDSEPLHREPLPGCRRVHAVLEAPAEQD